MTDKNSIIKDTLHPRNKHRGNYDFDELNKCSPDLKQYVEKNKFGNESINFFNAKAVKELNKALLIKHYNLTEWDIPKGFLCPPIPGRADYIHQVADLLEESSKNANINCFDVGVGANCIYPIIGVSEYDWNFVGTDINKKALDNCSDIISKNESLKDKIKLRHQKDIDFIFKGVVNEKEKFDVMICNPPFHASADEAEEASLRKVKNLKDRKIKSVQLNFAGKKNELWYEGGELEFVKNIVFQSRDYKSNFKWFTTLVSKKENLRPIYKSLRRAKTTEVKTIEMGQGNKTSRIVAWRY